MKWGCLLAAVFVALLGAGIARAGNWLPHPADATWTYSWSDTQYLQTPIKEKTTVGDQKGSSFTLHWTTDGLDNPSDSISSTGGAQGDVSSSSRYVGQAQVTVPAFPTPVTASEVVSTITQAGALGDPYGSGTRTVWWVYGVGPVKMTFQHAGGAGAPLTTAVLETTNQTPQPPPDDANYFPLDKGRTFKYSLTNSRHMPKPEVEQFTIDSAAQASARFTVKSLSGPMKVAGSYGFSTRSDGITNLWGDTQATSRVKFPQLGPSSLPASQRRHFFTPFDLMTFGFNPLLPAYAKIGATWASSETTQDWTNYGVTGSTTITGVQTVKVKAGTYQALVVRSTLSQPGFKFGSGTRTCWFAPGVGLVKLVFRHSDGSVSTAELVHATS